MSKRFTQKEAEKYYSTRKLKLVGKYINAQIPVKYKCLCNSPNCEHFCLIVPSKVRARRIHSCRQGIKYVFRSQQEAREYFSTKYLVMVGKYTGANIATEYECLWNFPGCKHKCRLFPHNVRRKNTQSCGCKRNYRCMKDVSYQYYQKIEMRAKNKHIKFNLTIVFLQNLLEQQDYKCALSGLPIILSRTFDPTRKKYTEQTGSLDRIDSKRGYTTDNVQWVHKDVNKMKMDLSQDRFIHICYKISKIHKDNNNVDNNGYGQQPQW
jgi:hypothetical protein